MRSNLRRGEVAALFGLMLLGQSFTRSCRILRLPERLAAEYVPKDWKVKTQPRRRWTGDQIDELREYWTSGERTQIIARRFQISPSMVNQLVVDYDLPRRHRGPALNPRSIRQQKPETRKFYRKLKRVLGVSRARSEMELGNL